MSDTVKRMVIDKKSAIEIKEQALSEGMMTLRTCGLLNILKGNTSIAEVLRITMGDIN